MTLEERVRELERTDIKRDKDIANISGKVSVIIAMNLGILLFIALLAFRI
jgi:hypothetical protein